MLYRKLHAKFGISSFSNSLDLDVQTDRQADNRQSNRLVTQIKNIYTYTLSGLPRLILHVAYARNPHPHPTISRQA